MNNEVVKITIDNTDINMIIGKRLCYSLEDANRAKKEDEGDYVNFINNINFNKNDVILDIGANAGSFAIYMSKKFDFTDIYSFEATREMYKLCQYNKKINNCSNITFNNFAVSDGKLPFTRIYFRPDAITTGTINNNFSNTSIKNRKNEIFYNVKTISLDDIFKKFNIKKVKLLKIDCEGAEFDILYNSKQLQAGNIEYIVGETHSFDDKKNNRESLLKYLEKYIDKEKMNWVGW